MREFRPSPGPQAPPLRLMPIAPSPSEPLPVLPLAPQPQPPAPPPEVIRATPQPLKLKVEYEDEGGGASTALWITLGLLVVGAAVFYLYPKFGKAAAAAKSVVSGAPRTRRRRKR